MRGKDKAPSSTLAAMHPLGRFFLITIALVLAGCASSLPRFCEANESVRVYQAAKIGEQWIDFVWVEIPRSAVEGVVPGRLFVASADPAGAIVPSMIDLPCAGGRVDFAPVPVEITFDGSGAFKTSYAWKSCAVCSECYMHWTFGLDLQGKVEEGVLITDLVLNETFHSTPMQIVSVEMPEVTQACTEPHLRCDARGACDEIRFATRP